MRKRVHHNNIIVLKSYRLLITILNNINCFICLTKVQILVANSLYRITLHTCIHANYAGRGAVVD